MQTEDYQQLISCINEVPQDADAAVLVWKKGVDVVVTPVGDSRPLWALKKWMFKWLGGREE